MELTAIVVGIDHYGFRGRRLHTPVEDALRFVDWLIGRSDVSRDGIKLFLSPESWGETAVAEWIVRQEWKGGCRNATNNDLSEFINTELPDLNPKTVLIFWGGHGFVDDENRHFMYTSNASEGKPHCIGVDDLVHSLARDCFDQLAQKVCIVDACAAPYPHDPESVRYLATPLASPVSRISHAAYIGACSASPGFTSTGLFAKALLNKLEDDTTGAWPDFAQVLTDIVDNAAPLGLAKQRPRLKLITTGKERTLSFEDPRLDDALAAIQQVAITDAQVYRLYVRSLTLSADAVTPPVGLAVVLKLLHDLNPSMPGGPDPMSEFMMRAGREFPDAAIQAWIHKHLTPQFRAQIGATLDKEDGDQSAVYARLFIEIDDKQHRVRWHVQHPDPMRFSAVSECPWNPAIAEPSLSSVLTDIIRRVEAMAIAGTHRIVIGLLLPHNLLGEGIETTLVTVDDALDEESMPLLQRFPVLLHWQRRAAGGTYMGSPSLREWRTLLGSLEQQLNGTTTAAIKWLPGIAEHGDAKRFAGDAANHLTDSKSVEVCIGVPHPGSGLPEHLQQMLRACLERGIPYFSWISAVPADPSALERATSKFFARHEPSHAPLAVAKYIQRSAMNNEPGKNLRIVWDDDRMLPAQGSFSLPKDTI